MDVHLSESPRQTYLLLYPLLPRLIVKKLLRSCQGRADSHLIHPLRRAAPLNSSDVEKYLTKRIHTPRQLNGYPAASCLGSLATTRAN